jgi:hypothetical protein
MHKTVKPIVTLVGVGLVIRFAYDKGVKALLKPMVLYDAS